MSVLPKQLLSPVRTRSAGMFLKRLSHSNPAFRPHTMWLGKFSNSFVSVLHLTSAFAASNFVSCPKLFRARPGGAPRADSKPKTPPTLGPPRIGEKGFPDSN